MGIDKLTPELKAQLKEMKAELAAVLRKYPDISLGTSNSGVLIFSHHNLLGWYYKTDLLEWAESDD